MQLQSEAGGVLPSAVSYPSLTALDAACVATCGGCGVGCGVGCGAGCGATGLSQAGCRIPVCGMLARRTGIGATGEHGHGLHPEHGSYSLTTQGRQGRPLAVAYVPVVRLEPVLFVKGATKSGEGFVGDVGCDEEDDAADDQRADRIGPL